MRTFPPSNFAMIGFWYSARLRKAPEMQDAHSLLAVGEEPTHWDGLAESIVALEQRNPILVCTELDEGEGFRGQQVCEV